MVSNRALIIMLALKEHLPITFATGDSARAGALMASGPDIPSLFRGAAEQVNKILRGTSPGDLPVEAADQIRSFDQSQDRQGARPNDSGQSTRARRRGDRVVDRALSSTAAMHTPLP
jgi:ABC transporter substrate binding protein